MRSRWRVLGLWYIHTHPEGGVGIMVLVKMHTHTHTYTHKMHMRALKKEGGALCRTCSLTIEYVSLQENMFSFYTHKMHMRALKKEGGALMEFTHNRMSSLTIECVLTIE